MCHIEQQTRGNRRAQNNAKCRENQFTSFHSQHKQGGMTMPKVNGGRKCRFMIGMLAPLALVWLGGCAATQEARSVEKSGFLGNYALLKEGQRSMVKDCLLYTSPSPRDRQKSRMPSSA